MDNRDFNSDTKFDNVNYLRTRLGFSFYPEDNLGVFIQVQDSREFGEEATTLDGDADMLDLHQAYLKISNILELPIYLKLGRFEAVYGNERLIGAVGWSNIGRSFDGGILTYKREKFSVDMFNFKENEAGQPGDNLDKNVYGFYSSFQTPCCEKFDIFFIFVDDKYYTDMKQYTTGFYNKGRVGNFSFETEFAYQSGEVYNGDISAMMFGANAGFSFLLMEKEHDFKFGVDYLSGDDNFFDSKFKAFSTLYATNHKFYGFMDYFPELSISGLKDVYFKLSAKATPKLTTNLDFHSFSSTEDYNWTNGSISSFYGNEIDITLKQKCTDNLLITAGGSFFTPGDIFKQLFDKDVSTWFYLMTTVNF